MHAWGQLCLQNMIKMWLDMISNEIFTGSAHGFDSKQDQEEEQVFHMDRIN